MRTTCKLVVLSAAVSATVVLAAGGVASAHINPDPPAMEAGSTGTVGFTIEHGCNGSPTTDVRFEIPEGVTGVAPVDKDGWTATVAGNKLEFKGGPLAPDQEDSFEITLTAPTQAGDIHFPIIQTCEQGELAWIEIPAEGAAEPEHPAPTLKVTEGPPTSADLVPEAEGDDATAETTAVSTDGSALIAPLATTVAAAGADDSSNTGTVVAVVVIAAVALIGGGVAFTRRRNATPRS